VPPFVLSDRLASPRLVLVDVGRLSPMIGATSWRVDAHLSWVGRHGFGAYAAYGMTHVTDTRLSYSDLVPGTLIDAEIGARTAASNLEGGALYAIETEAGIPLVVHIGVVVPIGASSAEGFNFLANLLTSEMRLADWERFTFDLWWVRAGVSARARHGAIVWQADLAASTSFKKEEWMEANPVAHVNAGVGVVIAERVTLLAELATLAVFLDAETLTFHNAGLAARFAFGQTSLHAGWSTIFGEEMEGHAFVLGAARTY
jgi:hypothetical protein